MGDAEVPGTHPEAYTKNPEAWLEAVTTTHDFVCIVFFRGSFCKYDEHYLKALGTFNKSTMEKEGLKIIAWTSEGPEGAARADAAWGLTKGYGFHQVLGDPTHALANWLKEDELLPDLIVSTPEEARVLDLVTPGSFPNGIVQPAMIWYAHHGSVALQWEAKVEPPHYGGPYRPEPSGEEIAV